MCTFSHHQQGRIECRSIKTRDLLGNPSPLPSRFPSTLKIFLGLCSWEIFWVSENLWVVVDGFPITSLVLMEDGPNFPQLEYKRKNYRKSTTSFLTGSFIENVCDALCLRWPIIQKHFVMIIGAKIIVESSENRVVNFPSSASAVRTPFGETTHYRRFCQSTILRQSSSSWS